MSNIPPITINDDYGNPINILKKLDNPGKDKYLILTDRNSKPSDLYINPDLLDDTTGLPVEYGNRILNEFEPIDGNYKVSEKRKTYKLFNDDSTDSFVNNLDRGFIPYPVQNSDGSITQIDTKQIYLGGFVSTSSDNEDPTILGYDIKIDAISSPLFNGSIDDFINSSLYSDIPELKSRSKLLSDFKDNFLKFFKTNINYEDVKSYYLKKISGIDNLIDRNNSDVFDKSFVNYGKDIITLTLNEDVSQNMGYLSSLYKSLSWSRLNGKQLIPSNLLRFNMDIEITEVRNYNRYFKSEDGQLDNMTDMISKYKYTLYECQLFFDTMPHGSELDMSSISYNEGFDIKIDYKYSTLKFEKFSNNGSNRSTYDYIDNSSIDVFNSEYGDPSISNTPSDSIDLNILEYNLINITNKIVTNDDNDDESNLSDIEKLKKNSIKKMKASVPFDNLKKSLINSGIKELNRQISLKARMLNKTINNIRTSIPGIGKMSEPTNVYSGQGQFESDVRNSIRNFVGDSIKGFFKK